MDDKWRESTPVNDIEATSWIRIFRAFDTDHDGWIQCHELQQATRDSAYSFGFDHYQLQKMALYLEIRNGDPIDFADFCYLMSKCKGYRLREYLFKAARSVTPKSQRVNVFNKLQLYKCLPPPLFMLFISMLQLMFYIYYVVDSEEGVWLSGPIPTISPLILSPRRILEFWRLLTYCLINIGIFHTVFNILVQLIIGIPLELVHTWRIYLLYLFGLIFGALLTLALDSPVILCGAAAGSFAILTSHIITIIVNFREMDYACVKLPLLIFAGIADFLLACLQRFYSERIDKVSMYGHIGGMVAGVLFTFILLRQTGASNSRFYTVAFWVALVISGFYIAICLALIFAPNLIHS